MDAVEYFKIKGRMCAANDDVCDDCPLAIDCFSKELENPEEAVKIVNEWNESHPRRTRQTEFLEMYPNARMIDSNINDDLVIDIKPCVLMADYATEKWCEKWSCLACKKLYWWKPLPEKKMKKLDSVEEQRPAPDTNAEDTIHRWMAIDAINHELRCGAVIDQS